jgi:hypothetical protein
MKIDTDAVEWLESDLAALHRMKPKLGPAPKLSDFHKLAVTVIRRGMGCGIYNVRANWEKAEFHPRFLRVTIACPAWATFDFSELTRLVIAAHDACLRLQIAPVSRGYMAVFLSPREREGGMAVRHPTIEQAIADFRGVVPA